MFIIVKSNEQVNQTHLLATENELISSLCWERTQRAYACRAPAHRLPRSWVVEEYDQRNLPNTIEYVMKGTQGKNQHT